MWGYVVENVPRSPTNGIPEGYLPRSVGELQEYMDETLASGEITVTETARSLALDIISPGGLWAGQPLVWLMQLPTIGLLPLAIRSAYGFPWDSRHEAALRLSAELVRGLLPWHPLSSATGLTAVLVAFQTPNKRPPAPACFLHQQNSKQGPQGASSAKGICR